MKEQTVARLFAVAVMAMLIGVFSLSLLFGSPTQAAPPAAPTPVADLLIPAGRATAFSIQTITGLIADNNTTGIEVMNLGAVDIQYVVDHVASGEVNTTTLTVQYSNDNSNWVSGVALVTDSAVDGTSITRVPVFGRYMRINQNVTNTTLVTTTLTAVGR